MNRYELLCSTRPKQQAYVALDFNDSIEDRLEAIDSLDFSSVDDSDDTDFDGLDFEEIVHDHR